MGNFGGLLVLIISFAVTVGGGIMVKALKAKGVIKTGGIIDVATGAVVTQDTIDKQVEAVLAYLKVNTALADKIGDYVAAIVIAIVGSPQASPDVDAGGTFTKSGLRKSVVSDVAAAAIDGPTPINEAITAVVPTSLVTGVKYAVSQAVVEHVITDRNIKV